MLLNIGQLLYIVYQMRPIKFDPDLDKVYESLFAPMAVSRIQVDVQIFCPNLFDLVWKDGWDDLNSERKGGMHFKQIDTFKHDSKCSRS